MGDVCLGVVKGLTLGGALIWTLIDWFAVIGNAIAADTSYPNTFGEGVWSGSIEYAQYLAIAGVCFTCFTAYRNSKAMEEQIRAKMVGGVGPPPPPPPS